MSEKEFKKNASTTPLAMAETIEIHLNYLLLVESIASLPLPVWDALDRTPLESIDQAIREIGFL